jgi:hypothetical protein
MALTDKLVAIANAIRCKTGKEDPLTLVQMATEIEGIETGLTEEEAQAMVEAAIANLKLQSKTVTPTDADQTITADEGYFGLASVIVEAAEGGGIPENARLYYVGYASSEFNTSALNFTSSAVGKSLEG